MANGKSYLLMDTGPKVANKEMMHCVETTTPKERSTTTTLKVIVHRLASMQLGVVQLGCQGILATSHNNQRLRLHNCTSILVYAIILIKNLSILH